MKKQLIIIMIVVASVTTYVVSDTSVQDPHIVPVQSNKDKSASEPVNSLVNTKTVMDVKSTSSRANNSVSSEQTLVIWSEIKTLLSDGKVDVSLEKQLINSLKQRPNSEVYLEVSQLLQQPDDNLTSRNQEYLLSLLAAVNSPESVSLLLSTLESEQVLDSNAIYSAKKSIQKIARTDTHMNLFQSTFSNMNSDNIFLPDIANAIATNVSESSFDFIINQIDTASNKSVIAMNSMELITQEKLVPKLQNIINTREPNSEISQVSLTTLANMGQYEATAALIQWSAAQPSSADSLVGELFYSAASRSPSAYRAIEKELNSYDFSSDKIKETIQNVYSNR
ncbi:hypothetical protein [Shewanella ulleungensis]|uniref:hypothetical protein n=1 Tax=Shewanella ulleungensis TaxID=2282699 RepID=UPI003D7AE40B